MASVLFIRPLCEGEEPEFAEPLGIERLAGYLRDHGIADVLVLDRRLAPMERAQGRVGPDSPGFYEEVRAHYSHGRAPDIVGVSLMTAADVPDARRILSRLGAWWPSSCKVAGGVYVTGAPAEAARVLPSDVTLLCGEGELQLLALARGKQPSELSVAYGMPDEWAIPERRDLERYAACGCAVNVQSSRGCPGACTFCATPMLPPSLRRWQPRSMSLVVDEVEEAAGRLLAAELPPIFNFVDDDFGPLARLEQFASELERRHLHVAFACEMRLAALIGQRELVQRLVRLREAGLTRVFVGVESLSAETLREWHKPYDVSRLPEVVDAFRSADIALQCGYILWHRQQTVAAAHAEVLRLWDLGIYSHQMAISRMIVFPGCERGRECGSTAGFEELPSREAAFYQRFLSESADLAPRWTSAAIRLPYAAAKAHLVGATNVGANDELEALQQTMSEVNRRSFELFIHLAEEDGA